MKITDIQAACGLAQLKRAEEFIHRRKENFQYLTSKLQHLSDYLILPQATVDSDPSWFGYPITLKEAANTSRRDLLQYLDQRKISTRQLFGGNLTKQPYFQEQSYRIVGDLQSTDIIMNRTFWIGVYPGLTCEMLDHVAEHLELYFGVGF